jgi:hypothetical protein
MLAPVIRSSTTVGEAEIEANARTLSSIGVRAPRA